MSLYMVLSNYHGYVISMSVVVLHSLRFAFDTFTLKVHIGNGHKVLSLRAVQFHHR